MDQNTKNIFDFLLFNSPTEEQRLVLSAMEGFVSSDSQEDFLILRGSAGTGKTSLISGLVGLLNYQNKNYELIAPTGRAARIIGNKTKSSSSTIHSLIYIPLSDVKKGQVDFELKQYSLNVETIFIVDEASLIGNTQKVGDIFNVPGGLLDDLMSFIKSANVKNKIILIGDAYQLPPVKETESKALNRSFLISKYNFLGKEYELSEVKRQEDGSYILDNAEEIKRSIDNDKGDIEIRGEKAGSIYKAADAYLRHTESHGLDSAITISVSNKANKFFNDMVRQKVFGHAKKVLEVGDLLMVTRSWKRRGQILYNGDHVRVAEIDWTVQEQVAGLHFVPIKCITVSDKPIEVQDLLILESVLSMNGNLTMKLEGELRRQRYIKNKVYQKSANPQDDKYVGAIRATYGYAITCHKAQGGEWDKVFINTLGIPGLKWKYTAVTRAKKDITKF